MKPLPDALSITNAMRQLSLKVVYARIKKLEGTDETAIRILANVFKPSRKAPRKTLEHLRK